MGLQFRGIGAGNLSLEASETNRITLGEGVGNMSLEAELRFMLAA